MKNIWNCFNRFIPLSTEIFILLSFILIISTVDYFIINLHNTSNEYEESIRPDFPINNSIVELTLMPRISQFFLASFHRKFIAFLLASPSRLTSYPWTGGASYSSACVHARNATRSTSEWNKDDGAQWYRRDFYAAAATPQVVSESIVAPCRQTTLSPSPRDTTKNHSRVIDENNFASNFASVV